MKIVNGRVVGMAIRDDKKKKKATPKKGLKQGCVVVLKSGGPRMTVRDNNGNGFILCDWFDGNNSRQDVFHEQELEEYVEPTETGDR